MMLPLPFFALMLVFAGLLVGGLVAFGLARNRYLRPDAYTTGTNVDQVKGRAPGSSDHAPSIRRTEARAKQPLERPPP